jgi:hypothetical protein
MRHQSGMSHETVTAAARISPCNHGETERIGSNKGMVFARCLGCQAVIVADRDRRLAIPPVRKAG